MRRVDRADKRANQAGFLWSVTFADLLTLLLCFFLVTASQSRREGATPEGNNLEVPIVLPASEVRASLRSSGTLVAHLPGMALPRTGEVTVPFGPESLASSGAELLPAALEDVLERVGAGSYRPFRVTLRPCTGGAEEVSANLLVGLWRQVVDAGALPDETRIEVAGAGCRRDPAAVLEMSLEVRATDG